MDRQLWPCWLGQYLISQRKSTKIFDPIPARLIRGNTHDALRLHLTNQPRQKTRWGGGLFFWNHAMYLRSMILRKLLHSQLRVPIGGVFGGPYVARSVSEDDAPQCWIQAKAWYKAELRSSMSTKWDFQNQMDEHKIHLFPAAETCETPTVPWSW